MTPSFEKPNLTAQSPTLVLDAAPAFEPGLAVLSGVEVARGAAGEFASSMRP